MKRLFLLALCLGLIPLSCEKYGTDLDYMLINGLDINAYLNVYPQWPYHNDTVTSDDSVFFLVSPRINYVTATYEWSFSTSALATEPAPKGTKGLKHSIDSLQVFASRDFNGIPAGEDITRHLCGVHSIKENDVWVPYCKDFSYVVERMNQSEEAVGEWVAFRNYPQDTGYYTFSFRLFVAKDEVFEAESLPLYFVH